ncbi:putative 2-aminoethylphosphonate ABC transporter ATP-binding protein [Herbaspirillum lusitanum]|uniref:2-aminoethylphosphonate ABC transporter ATP-binding protein n=1 Tax=Herbaspirillum lusitanum TaxID=213312 RepID=A0ABW9AE66_9BURK
MSSYLSIRGLEKSFAARTVLQHLDLDIAKGEFVCLLGPSGCGKTTLLRQIAGLDLTDAGSITMQGRDITRLPPAQRDYGIVFQSYALFPNLSAADNIAYGLRGPRKQRQARVAELLALVGLEHLQGHYPAQLSGGQQQRVALARALATAPGLLLLDEPLSALDARVREHLRLEIKSLQQKLHVTTIMVTHDQEEALLMADRVVVMNGGRIEQIGAPLEVYRDPASRFVAGFVGQGNWLDATADGKGGLRIGMQEMAMPVWPGHAEQPQLQDGQPLKLFLRPEEVSLHGGDAALPGQVMASVDKLELLGPIYRIGLTVAAWNHQQLRADVTHEQLAALGLPGRASLPLSLTAARLKAYPASAAKQAEHSAAGAQA